MIWKKPPNFFSVESHPWKAPIYDIADTFFWLWMHLRKFVYNQNPWNVESPVFHEVDRFSSPNSTWTVQNVFDNLDIHLPILEDCAPPQVNSKTGNYINIVLIFLSIVRQQRGPKMWPHCTHHPKYTLPCLPEVYRKPLKYGYLHIMDTQQWSQQCYFRGDPLYMAIPQAAFSWAKDQCATAVSEFCRS